MSGTIAADILETSSGNIDLASLSQAICRAWVNFNGTGTIAIRDSFNITSITDSGTGEYIVNFTNALSNANYCCIYSTGGTSGGASSKSPKDSTTNTTTATTLYSVTSTTGALVDQAYNHVAIFGD